MLSGRFAPTSTSTGRPASRTCSSTPCPTGVSWSCATGRSRRTSSTCSELPRRHCSGDRRSGQLVVLHELGLEAARLLEERRVHAGKLPPVGRLVRLHTRLDQALVRAVHVVGAEAEVPEVDVRIGG